ncbi:MAG: hypothetical protein AAGC60_16240 [Acidobacteriota bacterium]
MTSSTPDPSAPVHPPEASAPAATPSSSPLDPARRRAETDQYLRLLSIGYYITAALTALVGLMPLIHIAIGIGMLTGNLGETAPDELWVMRLMGGFFLLIAALLIACFFASAGVFFVAARRMPERKGFVVSIVAASLACCFFPFGTVLGVLTFLLLFREDVRPTFDLDAAVAA